MVHRFVVVAMLALCVVGSTHAAEVIVNEYNAVDDDEFLQNGNSDPFLGRRLENGGDWFEVVVIQDHLDMRDWDFRVTRGGGLPEVFLLVLTTDLIWSDLRSGTIITVSEDIPNNVDDYQPETGDWWINVRADANALGSFITASNFKTGNDLTQITVRDAGNQDIFGPAGEGVNPLRGVGSNEVFKLEANPSSSIIPGSCIDLFPLPDTCTPSYWENGSSSTYGQPNRWSGGAMEQDFSALRSVVPYSPLTSVIINEVNTHSDLPEEDWIELHNLTGSPIDVGGWFLSDGTDNLQEYQFPPATTIPAFGDLVITETELVVFALNGESGDEVFLSQGDGMGGMTGARTWIGFGPIENGVSWGRWPSGGGPLYRMSPKTMGARNSSPLISPVVINEIMYNPECQEPLPPICPPTGDCCPDTASITHNEQEYIELYNSSKSSVDLWRDFGADGTFGWRLTGGVDFEFAVGTTIDPGEFLLVVRFDPLLQPTKLADFKAHYGLAESVAIVGPYIGGLNDFHEQVDLRRPDFPNLDPECMCQVAPLVVWDGVHYYDFDEWPVEADGAGSSLERINARGVSQPPTNWGASVLFNGTPGAANSIAVTMVPALSARGSALLAGLLICLAVVGLRRRSARASAHSSS